MENFEDRSLSCPLVASNNISATFDKVEKWLSFYEVAF